MNNVSLVGRIAGDIDLSTTKNGDSRVFFVLAVNRTRSEEADFIPCVAWRGQADAIAEYCSKGKELRIVGELRTRREERADGSYQNFYEVSCERVIFGRDSAKVQRERELTEGGDNEDALVQKLMAQHQREQRRARRPAARRRQNNSPSPEMASLVAKLIEQGMDPKQAAQAAVKALGGNSQPSGRSNQRQDADRGYEDPFANA
jgi:single-strand DNA-binding protein